MTNHLRKTAGHRKLLSLEQLESRRLLAADFRTYDGSDNNLLHSEWGQADTQLVRVTQVEYEDGMSEPAGGMDGAGRPNARELSNRLSTQVGDVFNERGMTNFVFQWGQFVDHDLDLTDSASPVEDFSIMAPPDDPHMFPGGMVPVRRSHYDESTGDSTSNPRQQVNQISSFIDASNVYGSDHVRASALRLHEAGLLKTSDGDLLPYNEAGLPNAAPPPLPSDAYFLAGDVRANEQPGLTAMHTLFVREHNRLAAEIAAEEFDGEDLTDAAIDEEIYQRARQIVGAQMQAITYNEFLPALLGPDGVAPYDGYASHVNPGVANIFSAALYRVGHTMLPDAMMLVDDSGAPVAGGEMALADAFFTPSWIGGESGLGIDPILKGLSVQVSQEIDPLMADSVRNMLFAPPAQFDLAAINIQRGRDHGLPDYNQARRDFGLRPLRRFSEITSDRARARSLRQAYGRDINNIDVWLGAISEDHVAGGSVGELVHASLVDQFGRTRDGDRYYFENVFDTEMIKEINETRLSDIIRRNTDLSSVQDEVFRTESTFVFRAPSDVGSEIRVVAADGNIEVVNSSDNSLLASTDASALTHLVLFGSSADDVISIDHSVSKLGVEIEVHGNGGEDRLHLIGSQRRDYFRVMGNTATVGRQSIYFGAISEIEIEALGGSDLISGLGSSVPLIVAGGRGQDWIFGSQHGDFISGGRGHDWIFGLDGDDVMLGGQGRDKIFGGSGNDILIGGRGRDLLIGGRGRDIQVQGGVPDLEDRDDPLWEAAFAKWAEEFAKYGNG